MIVRIIWMYLMHNKRCLFLQLWNTMGVSSVSFSFQSLVHLYFNLVSSLLALVATSISNYKSNDSVVIPSKEIGVNGASHFSNSPCQNTFKRLWNYMKIIVQQDPKTWTHFSIELVNESQLGELQMKPPQVLYQYWHSYNPVISTT